jgi:hypothetical protein
MEMRAKLMKLGWLTAPQLWKPNVRVAGFGRYHA